MAARQSTLDRRSEKPTSAGALFAPGSHALKAALVLVFAAAALLRIHLSAGPGTVIDRQYRSYLIARAFYFASADEVPDWRKQVAARSSSRQEPLEPPITELLAASLYRAADGESLRIARLVPAVFWILGAVPLFLVARRVGTVDGALYSMVYYLLVPAGVLLSVSFLPESLMIAMMLVALLAIVSYFDRPSMLRLIVAASVSALAVLVKPLIVFALLGAYLALAVSESGGPRRVIARPNVVFIAVSLLPGALFYGRGLVFADYLKWKVDASFLPHLLWSSHFWEGWLRTGTATVGVVPLLLALLGFARFRRGRGRPVVLGLTAGYVLFCLLFNYFTSFLTYYHAQLIVIVALALGPALDLAVRQLGRLGTKRWARPMVACAVALVAVTSLYRAGRGQEHPRFVGEEVAAEIGELVGHSDRVAYVAYTYGLPLEYYGELAGEAWPRPIKGWPLAAGREQPLTIPERLPRLGFEPRYFVITNLSEFEHHHEDLRRFLETEGTLVAQSDLYLIYEMPDTRPSPAG